MAEQLWPMQYYVVCKLYDRLTGLGDKPMRNDMNVRVSI